ncbi:hypothetical protein KSZ_72090 [Dictyobacter formicarum]|uniref:Uncharacterized protein n=1 Tax=Dictyobacter formicarum TaxID=2778368 RepID=A0ABQ3VTQ8_9CHLR|nr:hypothetical protein KSZ_72090 [Dictyobacter formicarum]
MLSIEHKSEFVEKLDAILAKLEERKEEKDGDNPEKERRSAYPAHAPGTTASVQGNRAGKGSGREGHWEH